LIKDKPSQASYRRRQESMAIDTMQFNNHSSSMRSFLHVCRFRSKSVNSSFGLVIVEIV